MQPNDDSVQIDLAGVGRSLRRQWILLVGSAATAALLGILAGVAFVAPVKSTLRIELTDPSPLTDSLPPPKASAEIAFIKSDSVLRSAAQLVDADLATFPRPQVMQIGDSRLLDIVISGKNEAVASARLRAVIDSYRKARMVSFEASLSASEKPILAELESIEKSVTTLNAGEPTDTTRSGALGRLFERRATILRSLIGISTLRK